MDATDYSEPHVNSLAGQDGNRGFPKVRGTRDGHMFCLPGLRMRSNENQDLPNLTNLFLRGHRFHRSNGNHFHENSASQGISIPVPHLFRRPYVFCQESKV